MKSHGSFLRTAARAFSAFRPLRSAGRLFRLGAIKTRVVTTLRQWRTIRAIAASRMFDQKWYLINNPDVAASGLDPIRHYVLYGAREGRDPSPSFSTSGYLSHNSDVAVAGVNPLEHFIRRGAKERHRGGMNTTFALDVLRDSTVTLGPVGGSMPSSTIDEIYRNFEPINATKPLRCNPAAQTEVHTLTCHKHIFMYITAVKSLLRFVSDVAIVVHDDGSLTTNDIGTIKSHIKGIKVIRRHDADKAVGKLLAPFPRAANYRAKIINSLELTDHALLATKEKIIITNSDTLFLRRPDDVIRWIAAEDGDVLCVYEDKPWQQAAFLARANSSFPPHLTLGLICFYRNIVDPIGIEELLNQVEPTDDPWFFGQNSLPVLIGERVDKSKIRFLDQNLYEASAVFKEGAIFRHYWTSVGSLNSQYFADAAKVISELKSGRYVWLSLRQTMRVFGQRRLRRPNPV
jgi:hypothetical protein